MDRSTDSSYGDDPVVNNTEQRILDAELAAVPPPQQQPLLSTGGLGLRDGPPHNATASVVAHRTMAFTDRARQPRAVPLLDMAPERPLGVLEAQTHMRRSLTPGTLPGPRNDPHGQAEQELGLPLHPTLGPSSLQPGPDWFLLDSSVSGPADPLLHSVDPFLTHPGTNIVDFALDVHGHDYDFARASSSIIPIPPSGVDSTPTFDFDFNSPPWGPSFGDGVPLPMGPGHLPQPVDAFAETGTSRERQIPGPDPGLFKLEIPWLEEDTMALTTDRRSSYGSKAAASAGRRRPKKGKSRGHSTASGSTYNGSVASTQETAPFPDPVSDPSNPLISSSPNPATGNDRRRSSRNTKGRARSVATTTSASSPSTAATPSSMSGTSASGPNNPPQPPTGSSQPDKPTPNPNIASSRLRSASRASKNTISRPSDTPEERRTRASHNLVEKQYRSRLNAQFEGLLGALPDPDAVHGTGMESPVGPSGGKATGFPADTEQDASDKKVSKAEVLERARLHIESLERQSETLRQEREALLESLIRAQQEMASSGRGQRLFEPWKTGDASERGEGNGDPEGINELDRTRP